MTVHVGDRGVTESALYLTGIVRVGGQRRTARSDRGPVEMGTAVVVVGDDPVGLVVRPLEPGREDERLPDHGRRVFASPHERAEAAEDRRTDAEQRDWAAHRRGGTVRAAATGALAAAAVLAVLWGRLDEDAASPLVVAAGGIVGSALWGAIVFRLVDWVVRVLDEQYRRLALASTCLGLAGAAVAAAVCVPWLGLGSGLLIAALVTFLLAAVIPGALTAVGA